MASPLQTIEAHVGGELPDRTFVWADSTGTPLNFSTSAHTFSVKIAKAGATAHLTGSNVTAASSSSGGVVTITFAEGWSDSLDPGLYQVQVWATRTSDSKERDPALISLILKPAIA